MNLTNREYLANAIASIKILRKQSPLTEQERGILLSFPGGGILKECGIFTNADKPQWLVQGREELRSLLTDEEWEGMQNSGMQNSHYTLPQIRQAMWEALLPLIPHTDGKVSRVLDPGCGTAGFFWDMPRVDWLDYDGVDKDTLPVAIARRAMFDLSDGNMHRVIKSDFLMYDPPLSCQAAIGNVPFVNGVNSMKLEGKKLGIAIHAQFFVKAVQCLEPGAPLMFLTSTSTLDSRGEDYVWFRRWLHRKCEFIGALRLPADAVHHGNTQVTTDLIILRRRSQDSNEPDPNWVHVGESDLINEHYNAPVLYNQWFIDNPQYLLGDRAVSKVRGKNGNPTNCLALQSRPNFLKELREALENLTQPTTYKENHTMPAKQVIIADDKFKRCSLLSFILIENPVQEGIEVHFPGDRNLSELTTSEETLLNQIKEQGFVPTQTHPHKFYIGFKKRSPDEYNRVIAYMRKKVAQCSKFGATEIKIDKVDELPSCRVVNAVKPEPATTTSAPIVDAIAVRLQPMFDELANKIQIPLADPRELDELRAKTTEYLHRWQKDQEHIKVLTSEVERLRVIAQDLHYLEEYKKENEALRSQVEELTNIRNNYRQEVCAVEQRVKEAEEEAENLRSQLAEFGVSTQQQEVELSDDDEAIDLSDDTPSDEDIDLSDDDDDLPPAFQPSSADDNDNGFDMSLIAGEE